MLNKNALFRRQLKLSNTNQRKQQLKENAQRSPSSLDTDDRFNEMKKVNPNNIDENAFYVCDKVWRLLEHPVNNNDETHLEERLTDIQVKPG